MAIIRSSNRYGRFGVREIRDSARRLQRPVPIEMAYKVGQKDFRLEVERVKNANPDAVVHWGDAVEGALVLNTMREMGMKQPFFGCDRTVTEEFVKLAGKNAEGVVAASRGTPTRKDPRLERFRKAYRERFGTEAETYAAHAYDGMNLMLWAINVAGLNRAKIRDLIAYLPHPWPGVTGDIVFSACLDDVATRTSPRTSGGAWKYVSRTDLGIPRATSPPRDRLNRDAVARRTRPPAQPRRRAAREPTRVGLAGRPARSLLLGLAVSRGRGRRTPRRRSRSPRRPTRRAARSRSTSAAPGREEPEPDVDRGRPRLVRPGRPRSPGLRRPLARRDPRARARTRPAIRALGRRTGPGKPFRLVPAWSESPWQAGIADLLRLVYDRGAWAVDRRRRRHDDAPRRAGRAEVATSCC